MRKALLVVGLLMSACGEDAPPPPPKPAGGGGGGGGAAKPASTKDSKTKLATKPKIEQRVTEAERANIRHTFRDRDFIADQNNRDPFQSFVLVQPGIGGGQQDALQRDQTKKCLRADQFVASNYSYTDLRLVGIIAEKTQRRVLMMDSGNLGHIIKKGDCVGREKALVKDIGAGYITFQVEPDEVGAQARPVEEHSVQLYPNQMPLASQPRLPDDVKSQTPVVAPGQQPQPQPTPPSTPPVVPPN